MAGRHEFGESLDSDLLKPPIGVYAGTSNEIVGRMIESRIGIGVFLASEAESVIEELEAQGYMPAPNSGFSGMIGREQARQGELSRQHGDDSIIVHETKEGSGWANFYWPVQDNQGFNPDFEFNPRRDVTHLSTSNIPLDTERIVVFPSNTWHQFGVDAGQRLFSTFRHYSPQYARSTETATTEAPNLKELLQDEGIRGQLAIHFGIGAFYGGLDLGDLPFDANLKRAMNLATANKQHFDELASGESDLKDDSSLEQYLEIIQAIKSGERHDAEPPAWRQEIAKLALRQQVNVSHYKVATSVSRTKQFAERARLQQTKAGED